MASAPKRTRKLQKLNLKINLQRWDPSVKLTVIVSEDCFVSFSDIEDREQSEDDDSENSSNATMDECDAGTSENFISRETVDCYDDKSSKLMHSALTSTVLVDALETIPALKKRCARLGINGNFGFTGTMNEKLKRKSCGQYEIERILDHDTVNHLYLIKWKGYGLEFNTWEPIDHLDSVSHLVYDFRLMERNLNDKNKIAYKKLNLLICLLDELISPVNEDPYILLELNGKIASDYQPGDLMTLKSKVKTKRMLLQKHFASDNKQFRSDYSRVLEKAMKDFWIIVGYESIEELQDALKHRKTFFSSLKKWEATINNKISMQEGCAPIEIENNCDFDLPLNDFTYITECIPGPDVDIKRKPSWFCNCDSDCNSRAQHCCPTINGSNYIYNKQGSLRNLKQTTIFECNWKCRCPPTCSNRVIQNGRKVSFDCLFISFKF